MVDFTLTDEQKSMREMAHDFAEKEIRPVAWEYDKDGTWPEDIIEKAWELGLMNSHLPVEYGGPGLGYLDGALIEEELAWGCSGHQHVAHLQRPGDRADRPRGLRRAQEGVPRPAVRGAAAGFVLPDRARRRLGRLGHEDDRRRARATSGSSTAPSASSPTASTPTGTRSTPRPTRRPATAASRASSSRVTPAWSSTSTRTRWASARRTPRRSRSPRSRSRSTTSSARRTRASRSR